MSQERKSVLKLACFMLSCRLGLIFALIKQHGGLQHLYSVMLGLTCAVIAYAKSTARCDTETDADMHAVPYTPSKGIRGMQSALLGCSQAMCESHAKSVNERPANR